MMRVTSVPLRCQNMFINLLFYYARTEIIYPRS